MSEDVKAPPKPLTPRAAGIVKEWNEGAAASDLAAMHKVTRSSILGTIHRAKAAGHHVVSKAPAGHQQRETPAKTRRLARAATTRVPARPPIPKAAPAAEDDEPFAIDPNASRYADRQAAMRAPGERVVAFADSGSRCVWPLWGADARTGDVCGLPYRIAPDERGKLRPKGPYCEFHHGKAYPAAGLEAAKRK